MRPRLSPIPFVALCALSAALAGCPTVRVALDGSVADVPSPDDRPVVSDANVVNPGAEGGVPCVSGQPALHTAFRLPVSTAPRDSVDLLLAVDNSNSMADSQARSTRGLRIIVDQLFNPPIDPVTMRPLYPAVRDLHLAVVSTDLGTPGSVVPSCVNSDLGDDGRLNPTRYGAALRQHYPWATALPGQRPTWCINDPNQFPSFLTFNPGTTTPTLFGADFACTAYLGIGGCGLEQQLEAMYRALVVHNARAVPGNTDPNAGFVRDDAVLALVLLSDEEDGSTRDCRFAERGVPCTDAVSVFDIMSPQWSSADLNLRFYNYVPGSSQDPTWPLDRYLDPARPARGFTSLKPGRPDLVVFSAITGIPINPPTRTVGLVTSVDYDALLGRAPDGSDGFQGMSAEGPVSMRQRNADPRCPTRVVPACYREGSTPSMSCDVAAQYFAWPARRIAALARRFDEAYGTGSISSICRGDLTPAFRSLTERIQSRLGVCLPRGLPLAVERCAPGEATRGCLRATCALREILPAGFPATQCTPARGRRDGGLDRATGRATCLVDQIPARENMAPAPGRPGFFYDTRVTPADPACRRRVTYTSGAEPTPGVTAVLECDNEFPVRIFEPACAGGAGTGDVCQPLRPGQASSCDVASSVGCFVAGTVHLHTGSGACRSGLCLVNNFDERGDNAAFEQRRRVHCTCRCGVPAALAGTVPPGSLCACPTGMTCADVGVGAAFPPALQGSYCVRVAP